MIRIISINEINVALEIFKDVTRTMDKKGIPQWDSVYPDKTILKKDIEKGDAYGYYYKDDLVGYIAINNSYTEEYNSVKWKYFCENPIIIHRLAVKSNFQGQGIAKKIMKFAENYALKNGSEIIRLDAFSLNPNALGLYKSLKYEYVGKVKFRKGIFHCLEKKLI